MDYLGISYLLTSLTAAMTGIYSIWHQIKVDAKEDRIEALTNKTHDLVNSQSELVKTLVADKAFTAGAVAGAESERINPGVPVEGLKRP